MAVLMFGGDAIDGGHESGEYTAEVKVGARDDQLMRRRAWRLPGGPLGNGGLQKVRIQVKSTARSRDLRLRAGREILTNVARE